MQTLTRKQGGFSAAGRRSVSIEQAAQLLGGPRRTGCTTGFSAAVSTSANIGHGGFSEDDGFGRGKRRRLD